MFLQQTGQSKNSMAEQETKQDRKHGKCGKQASIPTLTYYYIRGLCQPVRNLLYYLNIQFDDRRLDRTSVQSLQLDKLQSTFNSGLPAYKDEYVKISDSVAISIHICKKHNAGYLIGRTIQQKAKINEVMFKYWMQRKKIMPEIAQIIRKTTGYHETQKGVLIRQLINKLTNQTRFLNFCLKYHLQTKSWVLGHFSLIDFFFYETCFYMNGFFNSYIEADERLGGYISFAHMFQELQFNRKHNCHKTKLFFPFKNQNFKQIVLTAWQGDQQQQIL